MNPEPANKIIISKEELRDSQIDEMILLQRSSAPSAVEPVKPPKSVLSLFYSTWFYLLLAGALGAFAAWALIEPHFEDSLIFTGRVESVDAADLPVSVEGGKTVGVRRTQISGLDVMAVTNQTKIVKGGAKKPVFYSADDLAVGQIVKVMAASFTAQLTVL